jgi:hypothetical protein
MIIVVDAEQPAHIGISACHGRDRLRLEGFILEEAVNCHRAL